MRGRLAVALIVPGFAAVFALAIGAGFMMGQTSFRPSHSPPALGMPPIPQGVSTPGAQSQPAPDSEPATPSPADQQGGVEAPQGASSSSQAASPSPAAPAAGAQQPPPASSPPPPFAPTATPTIPAPPSRFHVQAGSFDNRDGAASLVKQLRDRGYAVTLVEGPPYRVWVGGYLDRATAERLAANLQAAGVDATLTPR